MARKEINLKALLWIFVAVCAAASIVATVLIFKPSKEINSFQACVDAGGALLEIYPEQCMINGKLFTNEAQSVDNGSDVYIGLTEQTALEKATAENKTARVVEREGEPLMVTMDYLPGRLNLSIKDGKVYKVQVEGEEN